MPPVGLDAPSVSASLSALAVDREACRLAHARVVPRRFRVPHIEKIEVMRADPAGKGEFQRRIVLDRLGELALEQIGNIRFAAFQHGKPCRAFRYAEVNKALHRRLFAPIILIGLQHQFDTRFHADEFVGSEADRVLLVTVCPDLLEIFLRRDPAGRAPQRAVSRHEIRPWFVEDKPHRMRIDDNDLLHLLLELRPLGTLEAELNVLRCERVTVVEFDALPQLELVGELVRALGPGFRKARRHAVPRHRLHQSVVQRVLHPERRQVSGIRLARVKPGRRDRHINRKPDFALGPGLCGRRARSRRRAPRSRGSAAQARFCHAFINVCSPCSRTTCERRTAARISCTE